MDAGGESPEGRLFVSVGLCGGLFVRTNIVCLCLNELYGFISFLLTTRGGAFSTGCLSHVSVGQVLVSTKSPVTWVTYAPLPRY